MSMILSTFIFTLNILCKYFKLFLKMSLNRFITFKTPIRRYCMAKVDLDPDSVQRTAISTGVKIASARRGGTPLVGCTVLFDAGTRYETDDELGANHFLRRLSDGDTCRYTGFAKTRLLQQNGAYISCASDRQYISYTLRCTEPTFYKVKSVFFDSVANPSCFQWEIEPRRALVKDDLYRLTPQQRLLDQIQRASWTGSLSNSLYCEKGRIRHMSEDVLHNFVRKQYTSDRCAIGTVGLKFEDVLEFADELFPYPKPGAILQCDVPEPHHDCSMFRPGFMLYDMGPVEFTWVAVAVAGCGTSNFSKLLKYALIAASCGTHKLHEGSTPISRYDATPLFNLAKDHHTFYSAFNISYKNCGLFGIMAKTRSCSAWNTAMEAGRFLKNIVNLSADQIQIGRAKLQLTLARYDNDSCVKSEDFAFQAANDVVMDTERDMCSYVCGINAAELPPILESIACQTSHLSFAMVGDVSSVPNEKEIAEVSL